jgi:uncharacterized protein (DUF2252 family)
VPRSISNQDLVREILRTLGRMRQTSLVQTYWQVISEISVEIYDRCDLSMFLYDEKKDWKTSKSPVSEAQVRELRHWLTCSPQYVFSFVVGLAQDAREDVAWGMAYG